jgi:hypothetical protein
MVAPLAAHLPQPPALVAQLIERLPPVTKAKVLLALLGIVLLGLGMILLIALGARYVRRLSRAQVAPSKPQPDDWYRKPLSPPPAPSEDPEP